MKRGWGWVRTMVKRFAILKPLHAHHRIANRNELRFEEAMIILIQIQVRFDVHFEFRWLWAIFTVHFFFGIFFEVLLQGAQQFIGQNLEASSVSMRTKDVYSSTSAASNAVYLFPSSPGMSTFFGRFGSLYRSSGRTSGAFTGTVMYFDRMSSSGRLETLHEWKISARKWHVPR